MVPNDRRIKIREIAKAVNISKERVCHILTEELGIRKLTVSTLGVALAIDQKRNRINISKAPLERFKRNESDFSRRIITVDETWIHHISLLRRRNSQNSGLRRANLFLFQRRRKRFYRPERLWRLFFGIVMKLCLSTILKKIKQ
jgi:hypothetical protein